jgi:chromosome segregation ATPase
VAEAQPHAGRRHYCGVAPSRTPKQISTRRCGSPELKVPIEPRIATLRRQRAEASARLSRLRAESADRATAAGRAHPTTAEQILISGMSVHLNDLKIQIRDITTAARPGGRGPKLSRREQKAARVAIEAKRAQRKAERDQCKTERDQWKPALKERETIRRAITELDRQRRALRADAANHPRRHSQKQFDASLDALTAERAKLTTRLKQQDAAIPAPIRAAADVVTKERRTRRGSSRSVWVVANAGLPGQGRRR